MAIWDLEFRISDLSAKYEEIATLEKNLFVGAASSRDYQKAMQSFAAGKPLPQN